MAGLLAVPITVIHANPAAADCGSDGTRWPTVPSEVQGLTFTGTPVERLSDTPEPGVVSYHFKVDHVFAGSSDGSVVLTPWCVDPPFAWGERYLVSTADRLPLPGFEPDLTDGRAWFTDGTSVAWRIGPAAAVTLLGYDDAGRTDDAPTFIRQASTISGVVEAVLGPGAPYQRYPPPSAGTSAAPAGSPTPPDPTPSLALSARGAAQDDLFDLTIETVGTQVFADDPIPITTTLRYIGEAEQTTIVSHGGGPVSFGVEQLDGPVDNGPEWDASATPFTYLRGDVQDIPFQKSGGWDGGDPLADFWRAWFADPELRLPPGRYRITAILDRGPDQRGWLQSLEAAVVIEVLPSAATPPGAIGSQAPASPTALAALRCDGKPSQTGGSDLDAEGGSPTPEAALAAALRSGYTIPGSGYRELERRDDAVLYGFQAGGRVRTAVLATVLSDGSGWAVTEIRTCALAELGPEADLPSQREAWVHPDGRTIFGFSGSRHCGEQRLTNLLFSERRGTVYVRDPGRSFTRDTSLPATAMDTGFRRGGDELWMARDRAAVYVVLADGRVERWPRAGSTACA